MAEVLRQFADEIDAAKDFNNAVAKLIKNTVKQHMRIISNGNNYSDEWKEEAEKRGLLNLRTTPDALEHFLDKKNVELFKTHKVFTESEMHARYEILLEAYIKSINIEALTMIDMARKNIIPAVNDYIKDLTKTATLVRIKSEVTCYFGIDIVKSLLYLLIHLF